MTENEVDQMLLAKAMNDVVKEHNASMFGTVPHVSTEKVKAKFHELKSKWRQDEIKLMELQIKITEGKS